MKSLTVGIFHDDSLGNELGKKGTDTDIVMHNRKTDTTVFTFMHPKENRLFPKAQIMSAADAAIISLSEITPETGETLLMLDAMGISRGIILAPLETGMEKVNVMTKGTCLESFQVMERNPMKIMEALEKMEPERDTSSPAVVVVDHSFSVKGVGEVALGFVKKGIVRKHDKLLLLPLGKEITVRSIQMHDKNFDEAPAGARVGLCIKGASPDEMKRGSVIHSPEGVCRTDSRITLSFRKNRFYQEPTEGIFHTAAGMQTALVKVSGASENSVTIESEKPIIHSPGDIFLLLNLNTKNLHLMGSGKSQ